MHYSPLFLTFQQIKNLFPIQILFNITKRDTYYILKVKKKLKI